MNIRRRLVFAFVLLGALGRGRLHADSLTAELLYPVNGAANVDLSQPFRWTTVSGAQSYYLVIGTAAGSADLWASGEMTTTSTFVPQSLPKGKTLYARLWTKVQGIMRHGADVGFAIAIPTTPTPTPTRTPTPTPTSTPTPTRTATPTPAATPPPGATPTPTPTSTPTPTPAAPPEPPRGTGARKVEGGPRLAPFPRSSKLPDSWMIYPASGEDDVDFTRPFSWSEEPNATSYDLRVGTVPGASDVFDSGEMPRTSITVPQLAAASYFGRVWARAAGVWSYRDFTFGSKGVPVAALQSPASGSVIPAGRVAFLWTPISNASAYRLVVGTAYSASNVADSGIVAGTAFDVPYVPDGTFLFARLWTLKWGSWRASDAVLSTGPSLLPSLVAPVDGAASVNTGVPFEWKPSPYATTYRLEIGTSPGGNNLDDSGEISVTKRFVGPLPFGTLYGRLSARILGIWVPTDFVFTVTANGSPDVVGAALWATDFVRGMADDANLPFPGTPLASLVAAEGWTWAFCTDYSAVLLAMLEQMRSPVPARTLGICLNPNQYDCHQLVEMKEPLSGAWMLLDPTFDLTIRRASDGGWATQEDVSRATQAKRWNDVTYVFLGARGDSIARHYYLDYPLLFLNTYPEGMQTTPFGLTVLPYMDLQTMPTNKSGVYAVRAPQPGTPRIMIDGSETTIPCAGTDAMSYVFVATVVDEVSGDPTPLEVYIPHRFVF